MEAALGCIAALVIEAAAGCAPSILSRPARSSEPTHKTEAHAAPVLASRSPAQASPTELHDSPAPGAPSINSRLPVIVLRSPTHARIAESLEHLELARRSEPLRPEVYYNEGILLQEYASYFEGDEATAALARSIEMLEIFVRLTGDSKELEVEVALAKERLEVLRGPLCTLGSDHSELGRIRAREAAKEAEARREAEAADKEAADKKPDDTADTEEAKKPPARSPAKESR